MNQITQPSNELYHFGVKGMKWGVRKKTYETSDVLNNYKTAKTNYKQAKKAYNKSFNKFYRKASFGPGQLLSKKYRNNVNTLGRNAAAALKKRDTAKSAYKVSKQERKKAIKNKYNEINKSASVGEKLLYNNATRKAAAKYAVDNKMSISEAKRKANRKAIRNTALAVGALSAVALTRLR